MFSIFSSLLYNASLNCHQTLGTFSNVLIETVAFLLNTAQFAQSNIICEAFFFLSLAECTCLAAGLFHVWLAIQKYLLCVFSSAIRNAGIYLTFIAQLYSGRNSQFVQQAECQNYYHRLCLTFASQS